MYPVLKENFRDMSWVFHTVFGHFTSDAARYEITQEEFIEMINRIAIKTGIAFIFENSVLRSVMSYPALKRVLKSLLPFATS
jgi:hypothetical protein